MGSEPFHVPLTVSAGVPAVPATWYAAHGDAAAPVLMLAHGAGAPQRHPWMVGAARGLARRGVAVVTFDFPYMAAGRKLPDRAPVLEACWLDVIDCVRARVPAGTPLFIGGKSMGGRMATHVAARHAARAGHLAGLVLLGYPLHPPGRPDQRRDAHLPLIRVPALFVQGTRDAFGGPDELSPVLAPLAALATIHAVPDGDHSFAVPRASGRATRDVLEGVWDMVAAWVLTRPPR
ncbi:MAG: alpha/beta fold hydrolase [Vicinamibacterales bacterium]|nr:alpha/beta fold hydrolase [Vicinamibacterales bacterium]